MWNCGGNNKAVHHVYIQQSVSTSVAVRLPEAAAAAALLMCSLNTPGMALPDKQGVAGTYAHMLSDIPIVIVLSQGPHQNTQLHITQ